MLHKINNIVEMSKRTFKVLFSIKNKIPVSVKGNNITIHSDLIVSIEGNLIIKTNKHMILETSKLPSNDEYNVYSIHLQPTKEVIKNE